MMTRFSRVRSRRAFLQVEQLEDRLVPALSMNTSPDVRFLVENNWGSGLQAQMTIANHLSTPLNNWTLEFDSPLNITSVWNGQLLSHSGLHYVIGNAGYNGTIAANGSVAFHFSANWSGAVPVPTGDLLEWGTASSPTMAQSVSAAFTVTNDWGSGFQAGITLKNSGTSAVNGWTLEFDFPYAINSIWNAQIVSHTANHYVIEDAGWNATIAAGASVSFGFTGSPGGVQGPPTGWVLNGVALAQATPPPPAPPPAPPPPAPPPAPPPVTPPPSTNVAGYFHTAGNQILDSSNKPVRIAGVNWFGMETTTFAPDGLWARNYKDMMNQMVQLGFNTIRLPFSDQLFDTGSTPNSINDALNPDLQGLTGLQILDKIVTYAGQVGLRIFLDHHRSDAGSGPNSNGLWYTAAYPESRWISDWTMLAARYANNPTVIGADLSNEPHGAADWGAGDANDWRLAAERAGNAILAVNPNWLIIVEGVENTSAGSDWWGGNLSNAGADPVVLNVPGRVVYSPHDYPASVYPQSWFSAANYPNNLPSVWTKYWGYLFQQNVAPVLLGEFGSMLQTTSDQQWASAMIAYIDGGVTGGTLPAGELGISWTWWSWNPNSSDTGGILNSDWTTVNQAKVSLLQPAEFPFSGTTGTTPTPPPTPAPTPAPSSPLMPTTSNLALNITNSWNGGFTASGTVTNNTASAENGWTVAFDFAGQIVSLWNAVIISHVGNHYVIGNAAWNAVVPAGGSVSFGFQAAS